MHTAQTRELLEAISEGKQMQVNGSTGWINCTAAAALHVIAEERADLIRALPEHANIHRDVLRWQRLALKAEGDLKALHEKIVDLEREVKSTQERLTRVITERENLIAQRNEVRATIERLERENMVLLNRFG